MDSSTGSAPQGAASIGFDALIGNPPWISFAGRAAQPIHPVTRDYYCETYSAFEGYRNLQGLFVERSARLLRLGGRLGLVLPSSMSEQKGYGPTRLAHDRLCICDDDLPDLEDSFEGVFQPAMLLRSTRRAAPVAMSEPERWPIERADLDPAARGLLAKMDRAALPAELFGERGLQSSGEDTKHLVDAGDAQHTVAVRVGGDIEPFFRKPPSQFADPRWFAGRLWSSKDAFVVLVRVDFAPDDADVLHPEADTPTGIPKDRPYNWTAFAPDLVGEGDHFVVKKQWGAFYGTDLDLQLRRRGINTIVLCGIATCFGVESTARQAYELGSEQVFIEDAMSSRSAAEHEHTVTRIFPRMGRVRKVADLVAALG
jgi:nicotinamidase-related amidase